MACYVTLYSAFIFSILLIIPYTESSRCSKNCTFQGLPLNSSIPFDRCPSSNNSNNDINQDCIVKLAIDFVAGIVNGWLYPRNQLGTPDNQLDVTTFFSLNDTSIEVNITYVCSMSDYCDLEFVRETLSPALASVQMKSLRQKLADRLYNASNTDPVKCSNNILCSGNTSFCYGLYSRENGTYGSKEDVESKCHNIVDDPPQLIMAQQYIPYTKYGWTDIGLFYCNTPDCGSNVTIIEIFQLLTREYILPLNISVINMTTTTTTTTTSQSTTATTSTKESTTTSNAVSVLFEHLNIIIPCLAIMLVLH